jgi:hypothetical protein
VLKIHSRPFDNLRHTFISRALTGGENIKATAEQCGTSVQTIESITGATLASMSNNSRPVQRFSRLVVQRLILEQSFAAFG